MTEPASSVVLVAGSFLVGAIPWGYLAGKKYRGIDLRTEGSGGTGATNVLRTLGAKASVLVLVLDVLKGVAPVVIGKSLNFPPEWIGAAAVAAVAGHCWSPFIGFHGGKGVATGAGAAVALFPATLIVLPIMAAVVWVTRYVSLGSLVSAAFAALLAVALAAGGRLDWSTSAAISAIAIIIFLRHHGNLRRLLDGSERKIGESLAPPRTNQVPSPPGS